MCIRDRFRTVYYIPSILGGSVAIAVLWKAVFSVDGLLNTVVRAVTFGAVDVYKRQGFLIHRLMPAKISLLSLKVALIIHSRGSVSYTHLVPPGWRSGRSSP